MNKTIALAALLMASPVLAQDADTYLRLNLPSPLLLTAPPSSGETDTDPLSITGQFQHSLRKDVPFSIGLSATGGRPTYGWSIGANALGAVASGSTLVGTPVANGPSTVEVTVTDGAGDTVSRTFAFEVTSPQVKLPTNSLSGAFGAQVSIVPQYSGLLGNGTPAFLLSGAPEGVVMGTNGRISGTAISSGSYSAEVSVRDTDGSLSPAKVISITVAQPPGASSSNLSSVSGGTLQNGLTDHKSVVNSTASGALPANYPAIRLSPGGHIEITYDRIVRATYTNMRITAPGTTCAVNSGSMIQYEWVAQYSKDRVTWKEDPIFSKDAGVSSTTGTCAHTASRSSIPEDMQEFRYVRVKLVSAKVLGGASSPMHLIRFTPTP